MKIYTEINWEWNEDKQKLVEISSESIDYNGDLELCGNIGSDTGFKPSEGRYGIGTAPGSILGTIRRVGREDPGKRPWFESESVGAPIIKSPEDISSMGQFKSRWLNPYMKGKQEDLLTGTTSILGNIRPAGSEMQALGFEDVVDVGEELGFEQIAETYGEAETAWQTSKDVWDLAQTEYGTDVTGVEEDYRSKLRDISREQVGQVSQAYAQGMKLGGEESQAGFAYSGPQEQLRGIQEESTRAKMQEFFEEKQIAKDVKEEDLYKLEQEMYGVDPASAQSTYEQAEREYGYAGTAREIEVDKLLKASIEAIDLAIPSLEEKGLSESAVESAYIGSSKGKATNLWKNLRERQPYQDYMAKLKGLRGQYQGLRDTGITFPSGYGGSSGGQTGGAGY